MLSNRMTDHEKDHASDVSDAAAVLGRKGGSVKSERKTAAVRANAKQPRPSASGNLRASLKAIRARLAQLPSGSRCPLIEYELSDGSLLRASNAGAVGGGELLGVYDIVRIDVAGNVVRTYRA